MKITKESFDKIQKLGHAFISAQGKEILNPIPKELAAGLERPPTLQERVARAIAIELSKQARLQEYETLADAQNFDLQDEDTVRLSGYELDSLPVLPPDPDMPEPTVTDPEPAGDQIPDQQPDTEPPE